LKESQKINLEVFYDKQESPLVREINEGALENYILKTEKQFFMISGSTDFYSSLIRQHSPDAHIKSGCWTREHCKGLNSRNYFTNVQQILNAIFVVLKQVIFATV